MKKLNEILRKVHDTSGGRGKSIPIESLYEFIAVKCEDAAIVSKDFVLSLHVILQFSRTIFLIIQVYQIPCAKFYVGHAKSSIKVASLSPLGFLQAIVCILDGFIESRDEVCFGSRTE